MAMDLRLDEEQRALLTLSCIDGIGPIISRSLISEMGSATAVLSASRSELLAVDGVGDKLATLLLSDRGRIQAEAEITHLQRLYPEIQPLFISDPTYPPSLAHCIDAPLVLYLRGTLPTAPMLSIVGTRRMTGYTSDLLSRLLREIATLTPEVVIVSGLAYGVDVTAHRLALDNGLRTVGVVAHGHHTLYPAVHRDIAKAMIERGGGIVTEYAYMTKPLPQRFVSRNRIVAGLSLGTLVTESPARGGALITANLAFDYGRSLYAAPGRLFDENSAGCNLLIARQKASILTTTAELLEDLGLLTSAPKVQPLPFSEDFPNDPLLQVIAKYDTLSLEDLALQTGEDIGALSSRLFELEMEGHLRSLPGGRYQLVHT